MSDAQHISTWYHSCALRAHFPELPLKDKCNEFVRTSDIFDIYDSASLPVRLMFCRLPLAVQSGGIAVTLGNSS